MMKSLDFILNEEGFFLFAKNDKNYIVEAEDDDGYENIEVEE